MKTNDASFCFWLLLASLGMLGGCVKVHTRPIADPSTAAHIDADTTVSIYAASNPFEVDGVRSMIDLPTDAQTVGHMVVSRSLAGWAGRASDDHIIAVARKRARQMGGDAIVVLRWQTTDIRHEDVAALPVPVPDAPDRPSAADRWMALGMTAAFNPVIAIPTYAYSAQVYVIVDDADEIWLFGRPPVAMTARVVRHKSAPDSAEKIADGT